MISCTRRLQFCAGHRVFKHESKCNHLHGHNYVALFTAEAPDLDTIGRVIDFGVLKQVIGSWIDEHWDHAMLLWEEDPVVMLYAGGELAGQRVAVLPCNPTAENMAKVLLDKANELLKETPVVVTKVVLWETENCYAEVTR